MTGPFGWKIDQAGEAQALADVIRAAQSQSREPVYASRAVDRSAAEWGSTYAVSYTHLKKNSEEA